MDAPGLALPIRANRQNLCQMRKSNNPSESEPTYLGSLGVLDLDLTVCPDVFGLMGFDEKMPITRMLPGSSPCDLRLLIPDAGMGQDGFHDVIIENLLGTSTWRSKYVSPADVIGLRRRWPKAVFQVMRERSVEMEDLRRKAYTGDQPGISLHWAGLLPGVRDQVGTCAGLTYDVPPSWLGPVMAVPGRVVRGVEGLRPRVPGSFNEKHSGSETLDFDKVLKSFPAWTVTHDFWEQALKPEISGIAVDVST